MEWIQPVILLRSAKWVPACCDDWAIRVSCVREATRSRLCPIAQGTASAAPTLYTEYGRNGWMGYKVKSRSINPWRRAVVHCEEQEELKSFVNHEEFNTFWTWVGPTRNKINKLVCHIPIIPQQIAYPGIRSANKDSVTCTSTVCKVRQTLVVWSFHCHNQSRVFLL